MNEFEFIKNIKKKYSLEHVGDDCAVLPKDAVTDLVVTTDLLVEDIDFKLVWTTPQDLGHKALAVSLSDVAAMGGLPCWSILSVALPESLWNSKFLDGFYEGWHELGSLAGVELIGGDISRTEGKLVIDSMVCGEVPKGSAVFRSGAQVGESIYVSGPLGSSAAGLRILSDGYIPDNSADPKNEFVRKQNRPEARYQLGEYLRQHSLSTSMIDISDGLSSDLMHICRSGGVGAIIRADDIPFHGGLFQVVHSLEEVLDLVLNGGEDFELLFTASEESIASDGIEDVYRIGTITPNVGVVELERDGRCEILPPKGYRHF